MPTKVREARRLWGLKIISHKDTSTVPQFFFRTLQDPLIPSSFWTHTVSVRSAVQLSNNRHHALGCTRSGVHV